VWIVTSTANAKRRLPCAFHESDGTLWLFGFKEKPENTDRKKNAQEEKR